MSNPLQYLLHLGGIFCLLLMLIFPPPVQAGWLECVAPLLGHTPSEGYSFEEWRDVYLEARSGENKQNGVIALLHMLHLRAAELKLSKEAKRVIRHTVKNFHSPGKRSKVEKSFPKLLSSIFYLDEFFSSYDILGNHISRWQRIKRAASKLILDIFWAHLPFLLRNAISSLPKQDPVAYSNLRNRCAEYAAGLGLEADDYFQSLWTESESEVQQVAEKRSSWSYRVGRWLRPAALAYVLISFHIHTGVILGERWSESARPPATLSPFGTIPATSAVRGAKVEEGLSFENKKVSFLVHAPEMAQFFGGEDTMLSLSPYKEIAKKAEHVHVDLYDSADSLLYQLNRDRDDDVLVIINHGNPEEPGSFVVGNDSLKAILPRVQSKPLKPGASLFYLICDFGDHKPFQDISESEELWVKLARKKLHPKGGKAYAVTSVVTTEAKGKFRRERLHDAYYMGAYGLFGPFSVQPVYSLVASNQVYDRAMSPRGPEYTFPVGLRVYVRNTGQVYYYYWDRESDSFRRATIERSK